MLKNVSMVKTAEGDYGNLRVEATQDGESISVMVKVQAKEGVLGLGAGAYLPKYHFTRVQDMENLILALTETVQFISGR